MKEENAPAQPEECASSAKIQLAADYTEIVSSLLNASTDVNAKNDNDETPLHVAYEKEQIEVVKILLNAGANVNAENYDDGTPLHLAAEKGQVEVVKALLDTGADVNAEQNSFSDNTPLHIAAEKGQVKVVEALLDASADIHAQDRRDRTPLHSASYYSRTEVVKALLAAGANVHARNEYDRTLLQVGVLLGLCPATPKLWRLFLHPAQMSNAKNKYGETPLHDAAEEGQVEVVKVLIAAGADTEVMNKYGETPLDLARKRGKTEVVKILRDVVKKTKPKDDAPFQVKKPKRKRRKILRDFGANRGSCQGTVYEE